VIRHPGTGRAYRVIDRIGPFTVYQPFTPEPDDSPIQPLAVARFGVRIDFVPRPDPERSRP
jgi:hypothetical protein